MSFNVKNNIYWVGKIDWELRKFHGDEYSTHRRSSYNSYLIKEDKVADNEVNIKLFNLAKTDKNDVITEIFKSNAILVGSPTINKGILVSVAGMLEEIKGLKFKNKKAAAFGCYGWSGESIRMISSELEAAGFDRIDDGIKAMWNPDEESIENCIDYGKKLAASIQD
jgi:flavorubredoxin